MFLDALGADIEPVEHVSRLAMHLPDAVTTRNDWRRVDGMTRSSRELIRLDYRDGLQPHDARAAFFAAFPVDPPPSCPVTWPVHADQMNPSRLIVRDLSAYSGEFIVFKTLSSVPKSVN
ncbi:hypothetical protein KQH60_13500 [Mycetohabitans sp. B8]|uniref:hypothetical protein n=1 Tax=Mycetohabitans sp. B8 TaxID=2841845 RepID=UPI001F34CAFD|nr:hypothetical protein [Mycetohabitans sp. B8]MCG1043496.1 hypothetical protein [Mycetohabitans sp. B8]